ncbi:hypothetical protein RBH26_05180 [Natronolimnohabitans sp. A-GB9]|uniref:DUF7520 family protein n=1 Tax=Natronolimnohabitans sp. A-GB9 TaxID=3069757 RepID=UPI0027B5B52D|nr:hypothetical protein [Natronolimnohabitans sp. A-GB9]MDQ2049870.1 hypothetical protein [Natronolimnohabitans sp. A-GB9]
MSVDHERDGRNVVGLVLASVAVAAAVGAAIGYVLPTWAGLEGITVLELVIPISPTAVALYAGVTVGVFLGTLVLVVAVISQFEEFED